MNIWTDNRDNGSLAPTNGRVMFSVMVVMAPSSGTFAYGPCMDGNELKESFR